MRLRHKHSHEYEDCVDHHLTIPLGEDYYMDLILTFQKDCSPQLTLSPNIQGEVKVSDELVVKIDHTEARRLLEQTN